MKVARMCAASRTQGVKKRRDVFGRWYLFYRAEWYFLADRNA